ncbi:hypothetical protein Q3V23_29225 [Streptomyces sp. VNUA116]|nr:hypothetical protein [Streptomyces sp. VNUA116]WKU47805.1 hypothetical protein Q3V23_29225 [Streptomyces sp. VNUA116]
MCLALVLVVASVSALNLALSDLAVDLSATDSPTATAPQSSWLDALLTP